MNNAEWFRQAKFGMMLHWGLYSLLGGEYKGEHVRDYAEWIQSYFQIPVKEYEQLARAFNPVYFDAEEYARLAKECNMQYIVLTTKHHDGFAMYHSRCDAFNVYDATPFHRDVLEELRYACEKYGLKLGIYYSQDLDWHHPHGGGYTANEFGNSGTTWDNSWDFKGEKNFDLCFTQKILPQIQELMTGYGEISLAWFDVPLTLSEEQSEQIYKIVKLYQPQCLVNSRLGNGKYDYVSLGDNEIPDSVELMDSAQNIDYRNIGGFKPCPLRLYESACTLNDTWGFSYYDKHWKSPEVLRNNLHHLNSLGINYLLNVGPDPLGRIPVEAKNLLLQVK